MSKCKGIGTTELDQQKLVLLAGVLTGAHLLHLDGRYTEYHYRVALEVSPTGNIGMRQCMALLRGAALAAEPCSSSSAVTVAS